MYEYIYLNVCKQMTVKLLLLHSNTWNNSTVCVCVGGREAHACLKMSTILQIIIVFGFK